MSDTAVSRELVATACRVLAHRGLAPGVLGHVSLRVAPDRLLVRCRGPARARARVHDRRRTSAS